MTIAIYAASGVRLDRRGKQLTVQGVRAFPHRNVVRIEPGAEVARVWLLGGGASVGALARRPLHDTLDYLIGGVAVLLLAHERDLTDRVRADLLSEAGFADVAAVRPAAQDKVLREIAA